MPLTFHDIAEREGWADFDAVEILLEYIDNQQSPDAFVDFLLEKATEIQIEREAQAELHRRTIVMLTPAD